METGGRWGSEAVDLVRALAHAKARGTPPWLRPTTEGRTSTNGPPSLASPPIARVGGVVPRPPSPRPRHRRWAPAPVSRSGGGNPLHRSPFPQPTPPNTGGVAVSRAETNAGYKKLDDGWPESEKDVFQAALRMVVVKDSR